MAGLRNVGVVYRKEMIDSARDYRTIVSTVVVPVILIPFLTMGIGAFAGYQVIRTEESVARVALLGRENAPSLVSFLRADSLIAVIDEPDYRAAIEKREVQAAVSIPEDFERATSEGTHSRISIYYYALEARSESAARRVAKVVGEYRDSVAAERLRRKGLAAEFLEPFDIKRKDIASKEKVGGLIAGMFFPYLILILALTGAMYTAIDLTAGEKERGTLETLLLSSASRLELVVGKFAAVLTASLVTAVLAGASTMATLKSGFGVLTRIGREVELAVSPLTILSILMMILPVCCFFSALLISVSTYARSYKEAVSYLSPVVGLMVIPTVAAVFSGIEPGLQTSLVPILNASLALKEILAGLIDWPYLVASLAVNLALGLLALLGAVAAFSRESVLFRA